jgi:SAM-dependent methyltransferase
MSALKRIGVETPELSVSTYSESQSQTQGTFAFKWLKRDTYDSPAMQAAARAWLFERYCGGDSGTLDEWLSGAPKIILDAGCGSGFSALLFFGHRLKSHDYLGVDISDAVDVARTRFAEADIPADFLKTSVDSIPIPDSSIDIVFSEGVLHHTDDTRASLAALSRKLKTGGRILFYVYAKKAVIREYTDDFVRERLRGLSDEQAWEALKPLTRLGITLGKLETTLDVPEDIPFLGIRKGKIDIQRFFYWNVCKLYYRDDFSLDEMNHINFDWFRPLNCHRHTPDEIRAWCAELGLAIERLNVQDAGITVVAAKSR